jgi:hypothetical protein
VGVSPDAQWVALFSTDLTLSVTEIIEYYGARWKIEGGFKELKRDIGSVETQIRNPVAVKNHLDFCLMAISPFPMSEVWRPKQHWTTIFHCFAQFRASR